MTKQYPDWVYDEMAKRLNEAGKGDLTAGDCRGLASEEWPFYIAFAKLIHETQEAPEDPYLLIARKAAAERLREEDFHDSAASVDAVEEGNDDDHPYVQVSLTAIHALLEHQEQQA